MSRRISVLLCCMVILYMFAGCGNKAEEASSVRIGCMKGPTAIGMIKLIDGADASGEDATDKVRYQYTIAGTADELSSALMKGDMDIAAVPCNLASILYNKSQGEIVTVAINTLGVLYMLENGESVQSAEDLKGKTIYTTGQGTTPEYTLRYLLTSVGLDPDKDVDIQYKSEAPEVLAALKQHPEVIAMLPQPYATVALNSSPDMRIALDVTKEWEANAGNTVVTGVLVVRKAFLEEQKENFDAFMKIYEESTVFAREKTDETAQLLEKYDVFKADIAKQAIPYCNVTFITGKEMQEKAGAYLQILCAENPASIGGKYEEGMFYGGK